MSSSEKSQPSQGPNSASIELLVPCGLYCGRCPQYLKKPKKCAGCLSAKGFAKWERKMCGITKCTQNQCILRCSDCLHRPKCKRLKEFSDWDSFISHAPIFTNLDYLQFHGEAAFCAYIDKLIAESQYPPLVRKGTMNLKHLYRMMKGPFNPPK